MALPPGPVTVTVTAPGPLSGKQWQHTVVVTLKHEVTVTVTGAVTALLICLPWAATPAAAASHSA
jgi:hypothetical protein